MTTLRVLRCSARELIACTTTLLLTSSCSEILPKLEWPDRHPLPDVPTSFSTFRCPQSADVPPGAEAPETLDGSPFAFSTPLADAWTGVQGLPGGRVPLARAAIPARHVTVRRPRGQSSQPLVPIGGDFWRATAYPVARAGARWVSTGFSEQGGDVVLDESARATLVAKHGFELGPLTRVLHASVGGTSEGGVRLEIQAEVRARTANERAVERAALSGCAGQRDLSSSADDGEAYATFAAIHPSDGERMIPRTVSLESCLPLVAGRRGRIRVVDDSSTGHINVTDVFLASEAVLAPRPAVWGLGDYHMHPSAHVSFGGLQGIHTIWGGPGKSVRDYLGDSAKARANMERDLPGCDAHKKWNAHHGGLAAPKMINIAEYRSSEAMEDLNDHELADDHGQHGPPSYDDFPKFSAGAHQQYHITHIHRAYLGGLRLISALAVHNRGLEYGMGWVTCGSRGAPEVRTTPDLKVVEAHVEVMRQMAALNADWMEIAYTPADARRIIESNKLAVVLGIEVPQLGEPGEPVTAEVERLARLGIRQVTPIHAMDNALGGSAVFVNLYNAVNDWMHRPESTRHAVTEVSGVLSIHNFGPHAFFDIASATMNPGFAEEPVLFRLANPSRIVISDTFPHPGPCMFDVLGKFRSGCLHPFVNVPDRLVGEVSELYDQSFPGHVNRRGLTSRGGEYISTLTSRGMLIDLAHMSERSQTETLAYSELTGCSKYPFMLSHAGFRRLTFTHDYTREVDIKAAVKRMSALGIGSSGKGQMSLWRCIQNHQTCNPAVLGAAVDAMRNRRPPGTIVRSFLPKEFDISTRLYRAVTARGGVVGLFLGQDPVDSARGAIPPTGSGHRDFANDCAGSSKSFAAALLFARGASPTPTLGVASDFLMHMTVTPRFGPKACSLYIKAGSGSETGLQLVETLANPGQYRFAAQRNRVRYADPAAQAAQAPVESSALLQDRIGERRFDYNEDGLAHYGLLPDMMQDVVNTGVVDLDPLYGAAEAYIRMWERAWAVAGCGDGTSGCNPALLPLDAASTCGDGCPKSWNGGAPLQAKKELEDVTCDVGESIQLPGAVLKHSSEHTTDARSILRHQGDWAVFKLPAARGKAVLTCGASGDRVPLDCPAEEGMASYVKVRRVFESRIAASRHCDEPPGYPMAGNRRVIVQCLVGPQTDRE